VEANDAASICVLANFYQHGLNGFQQDHLRAIEQYTRAVELGLGKAHSFLGYGAILSMLRTEYCRGCVYSFMGEGEASYLGVYVNEVTAVCYSYR
jgi:TPR repeat protein